MRPAPDTLTQIDEMPGEEIQFGIGDAKWVMRTQAELYSDVTTAIIREYSTNAYDAHVMADNPDPIEVTLPSALNPYFIVKDKGVGMNINLFRNVYTQFGISDKRQSNDTNGMLGYGSKSGVAYTNQFTVTSVRDGCKITGVIMRKPDWEIVLKVVSTASTRESNGTTVTIPVHNVEEFNHKAKEFYKFWLPGRVTVNGRYPEHAVGEKIADNLYYSKDWNTSYVVMGNVAYRIANPDALFWKTKMNRLNFVAYVDKIESEDGGAPVEFTPSREDLKYTDRTKATLQSIVHGFEKDILALAKSSVAKSANHAEAFNEWRKWTNALGKDLFADLEFKGTKFVSDFAIKGWRYTTNKHSYTTQRIDKFNIESMAKTMVVTGYTPASLSSDSKRKAKDYADLQDWDNISYIIFTEGGPEDVTSVWVDKTRFVDWATLKAALPKKAPKPRVATGGRLSGSFDVITRKGRKDEQTLDSKDEHFYIRTQNSKYWSVFQILTLLESDAVVVILPENRINKFIRENPSVKEFTKHVQDKVVVNSETLLSDDAKCVLGFDYDFRKWVRALDSTRIQDPDFAKAQDLIKNEDELTKAYNANLTLARWTKMEYTVKKYIPQGGSTLSDNYPLLMSLNSHRVNPDVYIYLNAKFAELENNK